MWGARNNFTGQRSVSRETFHTPCHFIGKSTIPVALLNRSESMGLHGPEILARGRWDAEALRDIVRDDVVGALAHDDVVCTGNTPVRRAIAPTAKWGCSVSVVAATWRHRFDVWLRSLCGGYPARGAAEPDPRSVRIRGSSACHSWALVRPSTTRSGTSVNKAIGSTPFGFAVWTSVIASAQWHAPSSGRRTVHP